VLKYRLGGIVETVASTVEVSVDGTTTSVDAEVIIAKKKSMEYMAVIFLQVTGKHQVGLKTYVKGCKGHVKPILR
jgi:hypothetical protein